MKTNGRRQRIDLIPNLTFNVFRKEIIMKNSSKEILKGAGIMFGGVATMGAGTVMVVLGVGTIKSSAVKSGALMCAAGVAAAGTGIATVIHGTKTMLDSWG